MGTSFDDSNRASLERFQQFVARLSDDDLLRPLPDGWTVAAYVAHIAFWDRRLSRLVERWQRDGFAPSPYDYDAINDAMKPAWLLIPPAAAFSEAIAAGTQANASVASVGDELANQIREGGTASLNRATHREYHLNELEPLFP